MEGNGSNKDVDFPAESNIDGQDIPNDLLIEILERLPVRSLLRFKSVSKWCYDLIRTPKFVNNHLEKGRRRRMMLVKRRSPQQGDVLSLHDPDSLELDVFPPNIPPSFLKDLKTDYRKEDMYGSFHCLGGLWSNGILCIMYYGGIALCNLTLGEFKILPPCPLIRQKDHDESLFGAGFGITPGGEYKVILIRYCFKNQRTSVTSDTSSVHLYTSSTNSWKRIDDTLYVPNAIFDGDHIFFNGACHWQAIILDLYSETLLSFNMTTEVFSQLDLPSSYANENDYFALPRVINDCFGIIRYNQFMSLDVRIEIWVMKEYGIRESWTKQFVLNNRVPLIVNSCLAWEKDEWLFMETRNGHDRTSGQLTCYSILANELKRYQVYGVAHSMRAVIYEESLVSLK